MLGARAALAEVGPEAERPMTAATRPNAAMRTMKRVLLLARRRSTSRFRPLQLLAAEAQARAAASLGRAGEPERQARERRAAQRLGQERLRRRPPTA